MHKLEKMNVALVQAQLQWREPAANRRHLEGLLESVAPAADLAVLPETFTTGFLGDPGTTGEGMDGPTVTWMLALAARHGCVITGSAVIDTAQGRRNRLLWAQPDGAMLYYDKRHLFAYGGENERYVAGQERVVFDYRGWRVCPQVCYDIRFPVWCRNRNDYDLLLVVANWPAPRIDAWSALLRARAIENQCFVAAVNRVGADGAGKRYPGESVVHGPLGEDLLRIRDEQAAKNVAVDLVSLRETRARLPFLQDADDFSLS